MLDVGRGVVAAALPVGPLDARFTGQAGAALVQLDGTGGRWWRVPAWSVGAGRVACCVETTSDERLEQTLRAHGCTVTTVHPADAEPPAGAVHVLKLDVDDGTVALVRAFLRGQPPGVVCVDYARDGSVRTRAFSALRLWLAGYGVAYADGERWTFVRLRDATAEAARLPAVVGSVPAARGEVALTFDDGPGEWTDAVLDALAAAGVVATFYVVGDAIEGRESTLRRALAAGHEIGNHGFSHRPLDVLDADAIREEIERTAQAVEQATGVRPVTFRPPGLRYNATVMEAARDCGFGQVIAGALVHDWALDSAEEICRRVAARAGDGAIVVLHDGRPRDDPPRCAGGTHDDRWATVRALPGIVDALRARGFSLVTVSRLLGDG